MSRIFILFSILLTLLNFGCSKQVQKPKTPPKVIVCPATLEKENPSSTVVGQAVALEQVSLRARITGFIEQQPVEDGAHVKAGDTIFLIQKTQYEAYVLSAQGDLQKAQASLENATINYNRQKYLAAKQAVSQRDFDLAAAKLGTANGDLKLAQAGLIEAKLNLSYTRIIAPFDGKIGIPAYDPGNLVSPESGSLVEIVMIDPMLIQFNLIEQNLLTYLEKKYSSKKLSNESNKEVLAEKVVVKLMLSNDKEYPLTGKIDYADNVIDPLTGSILIRAIFRNPHQILIPGSYVTVILEKKDPVDTLLIPQDAIQNDQMGSFVYVLQKDMTVKYTTVTVGAVYGIGISVLSGLKANDLVVFQGLQKIRDGIKVTPKTVEMSELNEKISKKKSNSETKNKKVDTNSLNSKSNKDFNVKGYNAENVTPRSGDNGVGDWKLRNGSEDFAIEKEISKGNKEIDITAQNIKKIKDQNVLTTEIKPDNEITTVDSNEVNHKNDKTQNNQQRAVQ